MNTLLIIVAFVLGGFPFSSIAGELRYVVQSRSALGSVLTQYPIWTDAKWPDNCARATIAGNATGIRQFCEEGFSGLKPKRGIVFVGTQVELLDSGDCGRMTSVRIISGDLTGETGCIVSTALSSIPPAGNSSVAPPQQYAPMQQPLPAKGITGTPFRWEDFGGKMLINFGSE